MVVVEISVGRRSIVASLAKYFILDDAHACSECEVINEVRQIAKHNVCV